MKALLSTALTALILLTVTLPMSFAGEIGVYNSFLAAGSSINTATANSMLVLDDGLLSMWSNPAGMIVDRHQIYADGTISGAYSTQSKVNSSGAQAGVGMIGYLYSFSSSVFALGYAPRNVLNASADFNRVGEIRNSQSYSEITASYARRFGRGLSAAISAGPIIGKGKTGAIINPADRDTLYSPQLWFVRIGIKQKYEIVSWAVSVETPAMGKFTVERPINVGYQRNKIDIDYSGALGLRAGVGWDLGRFGIETDVLYYNMDMVEVDGEGAEFESSLMSAGVAGKMQINETIGLRTGLRMRFQDPNDQTFAQFGFGGSYILSPELTAYGSFGMMFPTGDATDTMLSGDLRPMTVRLGIIYHSEPE